MAEITVNQLNKYYSDFHLLEDISFELYPSQTRDLVSPTAAVKPPCSTFSWAKRATIPAK